MKEKRNSLAEWANEHPIATGFILVLLFVILRKGFFLIFAKLPQTVGMRVLHEVIDVIWPFLMVVALGRTDVYRGGKFFKTLLYGFLLIIIGVTYFAVNIYNLTVEPGIEWYPPSMMLFGLFIGFAVGFREESVFRGIMVNVFADKYLKDRRGIFITTYAAAFFFGFMHMGNMISGQPFIPSLAQSLNAFFLGALMVAIYLRGGNIWALIFLHGFYDMSLLVSSLFTKTYGMDPVNSLAVNADTSLKSLLMTCALAPVYILITVFLLRKSKCNEIIERYKNEE